VTRWFGRLDRYVMSEILGPMGLGFLVYTFILLLQFLFASAEMIIRRGLPVATVGKLVFYSLPNIVVLTIPMSLLLGVLVGIGRMASDSELIALRSTGVSIGRLLRPVMVLGALLTALTGLLMVFFLPRGNNAVSHLYLDILARTVSQQIEPRVFYTEWQGKVLYVFATEGHRGGSEWRGVFLADAVPGERQETIVARSGRLHVEGDGERVVLDLRDAVKHSFDARSPKRYETSRHESLSLVLRDRFLSTERAKLTQRKGPRELTLAELRSVARDINIEPEQRRLARVGIQKMFAIPAACLVMALLGLPLAFTNRHGGKSSGFAISIGVIVAYYVLISQGEDAARLGKISPGLAMWLPNLLLLAVGLVLMTLRNRDRGLLPRRAQLWLSARLERLSRRVRRRGATPPSPRSVTPDALNMARAAHATVRGVISTQRRGARRRIVLRLPRFRLQFPNLVDRYVLQRFFAVLSMVWLSAVAIGAISDLTGNIDDILRNNVPGSVIFRYYKYLSLQMAFDLAPIAVLVTTLVTFSLLSRTSEVVALRSLGISLYRLALPVVASAAAIALCCAALQLSVLPASNQKVSEANDRIKGRDKPRAVRRADQQWQIGQGRFIYNYLNYDKVSQTLQRLQVYTFDPQHALVGRFAAASARYVNGRWVVENGWVRSFEGISERTFRSFDAPVAIDLDEPPDYFAAEVRKPKSMSFGELRQYVDEVRESGQAVPALEVALQDRIAFPFATLVMALVALPFAFRLERRGALYGLGVAIGLGIVFMAVFAFFRTLGEVGSFPAAVAVWSPNTIFALIASYLFLGVRS
jgi:LPS export ABC transporter permease LptG/LPS export ABC transporter permease LptF